MNRGSRGFGCRSSRRLACRKILQHRSSSRFRGRGPYLIKAELGVDAFLPALGVKPEAAVLASALLATSSVVANFFSGVQLEQKRAELAIEMEREKNFQQQLRELQGVIARYRGPLLESAIDLEQRLWHLVSDQCFDVEESASRLEIRYLMFTLSQFLGFVEVVRREGPRENSFLQQGNPQGSDTLFIMVEAIRFVLCASPTYLEAWYAQGPQRSHPGARKRQSREEIIAYHIQRRDIGCPFFPEKPLLRISRGHQRAIGTYMIITKMGAQRHYTMSYGDFHAKLESDEAFRSWFSEIETEILEMTKGEPWLGESPFPLNKWSRVLLLQQLLVELMDLLDPDCVRLPLDRRKKLMPTNWSRLPRVTEYQKRLLELSSSDSFNRHNSALEGLKDLMSGSQSDEPEPPLAYPLDSMDSSYSDDNEPISMNLIQKEQATLTK